MRRREFLVLLGGGAASFSPQVRAQQRPVIGILDPGLPDNFAVFSKRMAEMGYVDGQTVTYVYRSAEGRPEAIKGLASELVSMSPQVIVTTGRPAVRALKDITGTIPIVFAALGDAIAAGAVANMARPEGNATGLSFLNVELSAKRLEVLAEAVPHMRRVAVLRDGNTPGEWLSVTKRASERLGLELRVVEASDPEAFERVFDTIVAWRADALAILASAMFSAQKNRLLELTVGRGIATIYENRDFVTAGGLLSYGPDISDLYRRAAAYVGKILEGAKPGDLPVEQPTKFELVINLKTAKALGISLPDALLARADEVIE